MGKKRLQALHEPRVQRTDVDKLTPSEHPMAYRPSANIPTLLWISQPKERIRAYPLVFYEIS